MCGVQRTCKSGVQTSGSACQTGSDSGAGHCQSSPIQPKSVVLVAPLLTPQTQGHDSTVPSGFRQEKTFSEIISLFGVLQEQY